MRLAEIQKGMHFDDSDHWQKVQDADFDPRQMDMFDDDTDYREVGRIGRFIAAEVGEKVRVPRAPDAHTVGDGRDYRNGYRYVLLDGNKPIGYIDLLDRSSEFGMAGQVVGVRIDAAYGKQGLGLQLYLWLLRNHFDALYADDESQTNAGARVWERLRRTRGVSLYYERRGTWEPKPIRSARALARVWEMDDYDLLATTQRGGQR